MVLRKSEKVLSRFCELSPTFSKQFFANWNSIYVKGEQVKVLNCGESLLCIRESPRDAFFDPSRSIILAYKKRRADAEGSSLQQTQNKKFLWASCSCFLLYFCVSNSFQDRINASKGCFCVSISNNMKMYKLPLQQTLKAEWTKYIQTHTYTH